jgi:DNA recombination protein RmuC
MEFAFLIAGILIGALLGLLLARIIFSSKTSLSVTEIQNLQTELNTLLISTKVSEERIKMLSAELEKRVLQIAEKESTILSLTSKFTAKSSDFEHLSGKLNEQKSELEQIREKFNLEFRNLANEIFEEKSQKFTEQNKDNIAQILKPLGEKIKEFEQKVDDVYVKEAQQRFSLKEEVKKLAELNQQVGKEAQNLTRALKGEAKTQGNWGEIILENILEKSGLARDREYFIRKSFAGDDGKRLQPDVIVTYPGEKNVVIDAKVSLTAYERFVASENKNEQDAALRDHLFSVRKHIDELSAKKYQQIYQLNSLDFVMLFMPVEPAFLLAIQNDPNLWLYAYEKSILLISPTNLFAALKMVSSLWQQEYQSRNVIEIARQSGNLYDKFVSLLDDLLDVGNKLRATQKSYDDSMNKLQTGRGNLLSRVENIRKLGAKTTRELPKKLLENNDIDENTD